MKVEKRQGMKILVVERGETIGEAEEIINNKRERIVFETPGGPRVLVKFPPKPDGGENLGNGAWSMEKLRIHFRKHAD